MNEKTMVADTLAGINGELIRYGEMISQTENPQLKESLKQIRNQCEISQEQIYRIAREKGYYVPAAQATSEEIAHVRDILTQG
jgi:spore coat protein CotF